MAGLVRSYLLPGAADRRQRERDDARRLQDALDWERAAASSR